MIRRAAVLGHPIAHSLSPALHGAAYAALGIEWEYEAIDVEEGGLEALLASLGDEWGGLSLTMPLKLEAARLADSVEPQAKMLGIVNTLVPSGKGEYRRWVGANTDVHGVVAALREAGCVSPASGVVVGGGATATSAVAALGQLGVTRPAVLVRSRARAGALLRAATKMGLSPRVLDIGSHDAIAALMAADAVVSTIPADAGAEVAERFASGDAAAHGHLLDAVYSPLVTPLAAAWIAAGGVHVPGTRMLLHQAAEQVRLMTGKSAPLDAMENALNRV